MGLVNLIFNGEADPSVFGPPKTKDGCWSLNWEGTRVHVKQGKARFKIRAYVKSLDHDFGNYTVHFQRVGDRIRWHVSGSNPHPHHNGSLCWGNMGGAREYALEQNDIESVAGLAASILTSFTRNGAYSGWWHRHNGDTPVCVSCGDADVSTACSICRSNMCKLCAFFCIKSSVYICKDCMRDKMKTVCDECGNTRCKMHRRYNGEVRQGRLFEEEGDEWLSNPRGDNQFTTSFREWNNFTTGSGGWNNHEDLPF